MQRLLVSLNLHLLAITHNQILGSDVQPLLGVPDPRNGMNPFFSFSNVRVPSGVLLREAIWSADTGTYGPPDHVRILVSLLRYPLLSLCWWGCGTEWKEAVAIKNTQRQCTTSVKISHCVHLLHSLSSRTKWKCVFKWNFRLLRKTACFFLLRAAVAPTHTTLNTPNKRSMYPITDCKQLLCPLIKP